MSAFVLGGPTSAIFADPATQVGHALANWSAQIDPELATIAPAATYVLLLDADALPANGTDVGPILLDIAAQTHTVGIADPPVHGNNRNANVPLTTGALVVCSATKPAGAVCVLNTVANALAWAQIETVE